MAFYLKYDSNLSYAVDMIGQNLQGRHAEKRADADYEVNIQSGREIETILQHLENLNQKLEKIYQRLEDRTR